MSDSEESECADNSTTSADEDHAEASGSSSSISIQEDHEADQKLVESDSIISDEISFELFKQENTQNVGYQFNESAENKALRENMERTVSNVVSEDIGSENEDIIVLAPDHPMLNSFHRSVANYLQKQTSLIQNDIKELNVKVKAKRHEADDKAECLYGLQQTLNRQRAQLETKTDNLANDLETRQELDNLVQELREQHKLEAETASQAQQREEKLWHKLEEHTKTEYKARAKKEDEDSKLAVVRRATEKAHIDTKLLAEEKKKQDEFVYRLTCEVTELQSRLSQLSAQLDTKRKEKYRLTQALTAAADDITNNKAEHHTLMQAWQRLLISAQSKDQKHSKLLVIKEAVEEEIRLIETKIEGYRKGGTQEMERNEHLTLCVRHLEREKRMSEKQIKLEKQNVEEEQVQLDRINMMLKLTEEDLKRAKQILYEREERKKNLDKEIANLNNEQIQLEGKIFEFINEQASKDKAAHHAIKAVEKLNKEIDEAEAMIAQKEAIVAATGLEVQRKRYQEACTSQLLEQSKAQVTTTQEEVNTIQGNLHRAQAELVSKQSNLDRLNRKLNMLLAKTGGKEISIVETKVKELEDISKEITVNIESLQKQLLRKEMCLLEQTKLSSKTNNEAEELRKHISHLQHKSLAQEAGLKAAERQEKVIKKKIEEELHSLALNDKENSKLKLMKDTLEQENLFAYKDIIAARKEEEEEVQRFGRFLDQLEIERQNLHSTLCELQKQQVDLDAKVTLAMETKQAIEKERGTSGEIAALKSEIHRMEVRLGQLKRTQERLTLDLDQCVLRRDAMVDSARARSTRASAPNTAYMTSLRKLDTLRHSNKQLLLKIQEMHTEKSTMKPLEEEIKSLEEELRGKHREITQIKEPYDASDTKIKHLLIRRKQNLEQLVHEQKRLRGLSEAKDGKYKPCCRSEAALTSEAQRQRVVLANILSVIESLHPDFPSIGPHLSALSALLKSIRVTYVTEPPSQEETVATSEATT